MKIVLILKRKYTINKITLENCKDRGMWRSSYEVKINNLAL